MKIFVTKTPDFENVNQLPKSTPDCLNKTPHLPSAASFCCHLFQTNFLLLPFIVLEMQKKQKRENTYPHH